MIEPYYKIIKIIEENPHFTQRKIAKELGYSVGKVNYVMASLTKKGVIKLQKFAKSKNKWGYRYILTPEGLKRKYEIIKEFLRKKIQEYNNVVREIEEAKNSLNNS